MLLGVSNLLVFKLLESLSYYEMYL